MVLFSHSAVIKNCDFNWSCVFALHFIFLHYDVSMVVRSYNEHESFHMKDIMYDTVTSTIHSYGFGVFYPSVMTVQQ